MEVPGDRRKSSGLHRDVIGSSTARRNDINSRYLFRPRRWCWLCATGVLHSRTAFPGMRSCPASGSAWGWRPGAGTAAWTKCPRAEPYRRTASRTPHRPTSRYATARAGRESHRRRRRRRTVTLDLRNATPDDNATVVAVESRRLGGWGTREKCRIDERSSR